MKRMVIHSLVVCIFCLHTCVAVSATSLGGSQQPQQVIFTSSSSMLHSRSCGSVANQCLSHHSSSAINHGSGYASAVSVSNHSLPSMLMRSNASTTFASTQAPILASQTVTPELNRVGEEGDDPSNPFLDEPVGEMPLLLLLLLVAGYVVMKRTRNYTE